MKLEASGKKMYITESVFSVIFAILILFCVGDESVVGVVNAIENITISQSISDDSKKLLHETAYDYNNEIKEQHVSSIFFEKAKPVVEFFASIAAILGIMFPLIIWFLERRPPFKISSITVFENSINGKWSYAFIFENRKNHPVTINETNIYTNKFFLVTNSVANSVTFSGPSFSESNKVLTDKTKIEVSTRGSQPIKMSGRKIVNTGKLFVHLNTSSGFQTIKCKKVEYVKVGNVEIYNDMYDINNFIKAKLVYYGLKFPWSRSRNLVKKHAEQWQFSKINEDVELPESTSS